MSGRVVVIRYDDKCPEGYVDINTTSRSDTWTSQLSPFHLGPASVSIPADLNGCMVKTSACNIENLWQYSKVYSAHIDSRGNVNMEWIHWAMAGFKSERAVRYPMGKARKPEYSYWNGERLSYVEARKKIYLPQYAKAVSNTDAYGHLKAMREIGLDLALRDFDGYRHDVLGMSFKDVVECESMKMGHAFVLAMMLEKGR